MTLDEAAEPAPDGPLVLMAADDNAICVDELCLPADERTKVEPPAPEADA